MWDGPFPATWAYSDRHRSLRDGRRSLRFFLGYMFEMDEANGRVIIHHAIRATSSTRSWSRVELVVVTYIRSERIFVAAYASDANPYFRQPSSPLAQFTQEVQTLKQAASLSKKCIEDPRSILPISKIENSYRRDRLSGQLETIEVDAEVDGSASSLPPWPAAAKLARTGNVNAGVKTHHWPE